MSDPFDLAGVEPDPPPSSSATAAPAPLAAPPWLEALNPAQRAAAEALEGPVLVLAGAGTGKTRVLTTRLALILHRRLAFPSQVLAVTFTNKSAREMKERVAHLIGPGVESMWLGTFHAIAARILRRHAEAVGLKSNFTILDTDDQLRLLKQILTAEGIDEKRWPPRALAAVIDRWKDKGLAPDKIGRDDSGYAEGRALALYRQYQERLITLNACDFGDLLLHNLTLFTTQPEILADYQRRFRFILVDEYQDSNVAQYLWLRLLAQGHRNICVVGDDDQCLAADTKVTMADGKTKAIDRVKVGDQVLSAFGSGDFRPAEVLRVRQGRAHRPAVKITTKAGRVLISTPDHTHFAGYRLGLSAQVHITYLMRKSGVGWRLGTTQVYTKGQVKPTIGLALRCRQEGADAAWVIATHSNEQEARALEYELSLRYRLPTLPFKPRRGGSQNGLVHDERYIARIFAAFDTETAAKALLADYDLALHHPHHWPRSRDGKRRNVVLTLCGDRRGKTAMHRLSIVGNDEAGARALKRAGFSVRLAKAGATSWRIETARADYRELLAMVEQIRAVCEPIVIQTARLGRQTGDGAETNSLPMIPAASIRPGMAMFTASGGYDTVAKVERVPSDRNVYDLDVAQTHNFIAGGLVTHNSIYGWRGAEIGNILRFESDFPGAKIIRLERNYRSTSKILAAASGLIAKNQGRLGKTLWTEGDEGDQVLVRGVWDGDEEARWIGEEIESLQHKGHRLDQIAILVRAGFQTRAFEERFITLGLRYRVVGGPRFYERQEIRDALAYFRVVVQPDDDLAFERIVNVPRRGLGEATLQLVHQTARRAGVSLIRAIRMLVETDELKPKPRTALAQVVRDFDRWRSLLDGMNHIELAELILDESGYTAMWQADRSIEAPGRLDNLKELIQALDGFENLQGFLEHVALVMDNEANNNEDMVSLMTMHAAKGLEFDTVFLPGWEEAIFPSQRTLEDGGAAGLEEERRLAYVGITRARHRCIISWAANRRIYGQWQVTVPSRFLEELPDDAVERVSQTGFAGPSAQRPFGGATTDGTPWLTAERRWGIGGRGPGTVSGAVSGAGPMAIEARAVRIDDDAVPASPVGKRVFHQKFGYGRVIAAEGEKLTIRFDKAGEKRVMAAFVDPA